MNGRFGPFSYLGGRWLPPLGPSLGLRVTRMGAWNWAFDVTLGRRSWQGQVWKR